MSHEHKKISKIRRWFRLVFAPRHSGVCRVCGCTEKDPCFHPEYGNCWWVDSNMTLCSHCADPKLFQDPATVHRINSSGGKSLQLVLTYKWWQMIHSGQKTEEYREITPYWVCRIFNKIDKDGTPKPISQKEAASLIEAWASNLDTKGLTLKYNIVTFYAGYDKDRKEETRYIERVTIGTGRVEWGAESDRPYIVLTIGAHV